MSIHSKSDPTVKNDQGLSVQRVVVLGGGSAGMLVAIALSRHLPEIQTVVVRSSKMGVIGVGEGTFATIGRFLHGYLGIDPIRFHQEVHPSIKLGTQFKWGSDTPFHYTFSQQFTVPVPSQYNLRHARGYYCSSDATFADPSSSLMYHGKVARLNEFGDPFIVQGFAYHLENRRFVEFLERYSDDCGIQKIDAIVNHVELGHQGVKSLVIDSGETIEADLFVDCSGFGSELLEGALQEPFVSYRDALLCDRAIVGGWLRTDDAYNAYTTAETMDAGWCWRIEHDEIINRGYVYSSDFISDDQAEMEFRRKNPKVVDTRVVPFRSGVHRRAWVRNVVAIGNAYGFVEPLEATAIALISSSTNQLVEILKSGSQCIQDLHRNIYNDIQDTNWQQVRDFLAMHYKPNRKDQTPFWEACRNDVPLGNAQDLYDYYQAVGPDFKALEHRMRSDIFGSDGYLAILVGQQVPYRRQLNLTSDERQTWRRFRDRLSEFAAESIGMRKFLAQLRNGEAELPKSVLIGAEAFS